MHEPTEILASVETLSKLGAGKLLLGFGKWICLLLGAILSRREYGTPAIISEEHWAAALNES